MGESLCKVIEDSNSFSMGIDMLSRLGLDQKVLNAYMKAKMPLELISYAVQHQCLPLIDPVSLLEISQVLDDHVLYLNVYTYLIVVDYIVFLKKMTYSHQGLGMQKRKT